MSPSKARRFVAYYRVSTERQGTSGLGLEAQQKAVRDYLNGGAWELVAEHVEIESGKNAADLNWQRPSMPAGGTRQSWSSQN